ncbi:MAG: GAF domain-containing protein, partial [Acetobacteraceae bacterium]|nr:GAF domain-containing protein [Acetobacteraceae bacterium]
MSELVRMVAGELVSEVCSLYIARPGDILELFATEGLDPGAIGRTRLRVGEGIVGLVAATHSPMNLADAQNHPAFAYRPETGEEKYASMLAVPVRRGGRTMGVLTVQNRTPRHFDEDEVDVLATVAMLLAEVLVASGAEGADEGLGATVARRFSAIPLASGLAIGRVRVLGPVPPPKRVLAENSAQEQARLNKAVATMRADVDALIATGLPDADAAEAVASREILDSYRLVASDGGWLKRVADAIRGGLSAEAAVHRVAGDLRDRMRRITDPYLRERLAD